ncbi:MAG: phosphatidylserine decarboxylase, partial [Acidobacteriota bacterium]
MSTGHQYVAGDQGIVTEQFFGDRIIRFLYCQVRESSPSLFQLATSRRVTQLMGALNFDLPIAAKLLGSKRFLRSCGVTLDDCVEPPEHFDTPRKIFERQIRYWDSRPMDEDPNLVVSPADARVLLGSLDQSSMMWIKDKLFSLPELLDTDADHESSPGSPPRAWSHELTGGDFAVFRLTPEKYHYNHTPVAGRVVDFYDITGTYHSCHPDAVIELVTPFSKNRRVVTIIDTDVPGGTGIGLVAMVEVVALMIGEVVQRYSSRAYESPQPMAIGGFLKRGQPKSLFRPGSSTVVLV